MKGTERHLRERLIEAEYEAKKQELKVKDLEDALTERLKMKEDSLAHNFSFSDDSQHLIEQHELQIQLEKFILYKMVHTLTYLLKEVEKTK
jgi:hypothetical protein